MPNEHVGRKLLKDGGPGSGPTGNSPTQPVEIQKGTLHSEHPKAEKLPARPTAGWNTPPKQNTQPQKPKNGNVALDPKKIAESKNWSNSMSKLLSGS